MKRRHAIVRGGHIANTNAHHARSYKPVRGLLHYIAFGHYAETLGQDPQQRGVWLDQDGTECSHNAVLSWAKEKVHRLHYDHAYQLLFSTRYGGLETADFNAALEEGSEISAVQEWRLMLHDDTDHQHGHVILFRQEKLSQAEYKAWQQTMQQTLDALQLTRWHEEQLEQAHHQEQGLSL